MRSGPLGDYVALAQAVAIFAVVAFTVQAIDFGVNFVDSPLLMLSVIAQWLAQSSSALAMLCAMLCVRTLVVNQLIMSPSTADGAFSTALDGPPDGHAGSSDDRA